MARTATSRITLRPEPDTVAQGHFGTLEAVGVDLITRTAQFRAVSPDGHRGPEATLPFSMITPLSEEDNTRFWKMLADELIRQIEKEGTLPKFYRHMSVTTGDDSTGDPAIYIKVFVDAPKGLASDSTVSRWNEFAHKVQDRLLQLRLPRHPYVFLGAA